MKQGLMIRKSIYYAHKPHHVNPLKLEVNVNTQSIDYEVDKGSSITLGFEIKTYFQNLRK